MDPLRVAVVGLGIGRRHIHGFQGLPGVEVVAVASTDVPALERARAEFGIPSAFRDFRQLLDESDVDLVSICSPDRFHAEQALMALDAGKHVLCEKPMTTGVEDAARLVRKVRETGLKLMVGHNYRFIPQFARAKQMVEAGDVGQVFFGESSYVQDLYFMETLSPDYWRLKDPQEFYLGGAIHNIDLLRWIIGEIQEVHSYACRGMPFYPLEDNYVSGLKFANGCIGRLLLVLGARLKDKFYVDLSVYGLEGSVKAVMQRDEIVQNIARLPGESPLAIPVPGADSHALEIAHFVACVREDRQPLIDVVEGAKDVAVCEAGIRSAREGKPVGVDYSFL